jgi:hypothetical protein
MKRIAFITALLAALAAAAPASALLLPASCGNNCATLSANGNGSLGVVGSGAEQGSISSGTIWVRDRSDNGHKDFSVTGWQTRRSIGDDGWKFTSKHAMRFCAYSKFWVKLQGPGVVVSGVFEGSGSIGGSGKYTLNGHTHSWPAYATEIHF